HCQESNGRTSRTAGPACAAPPGFRGHPSTPRIPFMKKPVGQLILLVAMALGVFAVIPPAHPEGARKEDASKKKIDLTWGVKIPLRDGVKLNATVYRPHEVTKARPVIFTLTPYIADSYHDRAKYFAEHGYPFVLVDVRGRGNSGG